MGALGRHILVEYYDCDPKLLNDVVYIEESMEMAAVKANATLINSAMLASCTLASTAVPYPTGVLK